MKQTCCPKNNQCCCIPPIYSIPPPVNGLILNLTASPNNFTAAAQTILYTYTITNNTGVDLVGPITINDSRFGQIIVPQVGLATGTSVSYQQVYITTSADVLATSVTNSAVASIQAINSNTANVTITLIAPADLADLAFVSAVPIVDGSSVYAITFINNGPNTAVNPLVRLVNSIAGQIIFTAPVATTSTPISVSINLSDMLPGEVVVITVAYDRSVVPIPTAVLITSDTTDSGLGNNIGAFGIPIGSLGLADLSFVSAVPIAPGSLTYNITFINNGPDNTVDPVVVMLRNQTAAAIISTVPALQSINDDVGILILPGFANGQLQVIQVTYSSPLAPITSSASITSSTPDLFPTNNTGNFIIFGGTPL